MDLATLLASSAAIAAIVGGGISFATQRYLLARKAQVDYEFVARKRLYEAIGPLRLQLLFAARDLLRRITAHAGTRWNMNPQEFYAASFAYRLLRPLAIGQLIERQMSIADFAVDAAALELLRFNTTAERMLTGSTVVLGHPAVDWATQTQHLFRENLRVAARSLIRTTEDGHDDVIDYAQFAKELTAAPADPPLADLVAIFDGCEVSLVENPLFWLRVVGYGYACNRLLASHGATLGFDLRPYDVERMLRAVRDDYILARVPGYTKSFEKVAAQGL